MSQPTAALRLDAMEGLAKGESLVWANCLFALLEEEGRLIEGGWPGTVSEARRRLMVCLAAHPPDPPPDSSELDHLVELLYDQAKRHWLRRRC